MRGDCEFPASTLAVLIDAGFMTHWPHEWTRDGRRALRRNERSGEFDGHSFMREAADIIMRKHGITGIEPRLFSIVNIGRGYTANNCE